MSPAQRQHEHQVAALAASYAQAGYAVVMRPAPASIPFDLHGYQPDLLATQGPKHLLLLVNTGGAVAIGRLHDLAETVKQYLGWRLLVVNQSPEHAVAGIPQEPLPWPGIARRIAQAKRLRETGEAEAAVLLFWSALEALLRRHSESVALPLEHLSVLALLDYLYSDADLSFEHFDQAKKLLPGRNQLAHGFPLPDATQHASQLQVLVDDLSNEWIPSRTAA